jgi:hypothetical protein
MTKGTPAPTHGGSANYLAARARRAVHVLLLCIIAGPAAATDLPCPDDPSLLCADASPWYQATRLQLRFSDPQIGESGRWNLAIQDRANMRIDAQSRRARKLNAGQIVLASGRVMLTKGLTLEKGYEVDVLNEPLLYYQLLAVVLDRAFPDGPAKFKEASVVGVEEAVRGIRLATHGATGLIGAPWSASGFLKRRDAQTVDFSLKVNFYFEPENARRVVTLQGAWKKAARAPALAASMSLEGWKVRAIDRETLRPQTLAILDYGPRTLGDLQAALRASARAPGGKAKP